MGAPLFDKAVRVEHAPLMGATVAERAGRAFGERIVNRRVCLPVPKRRGHMGHAVPTVQCLRTSCREPEELGFRFLDGVSGQACADPRRGSSQPIAGTRRPLGTRIGTNGETYRSARPCHSQGSVSPTAHRCSPRRDCLQSRVVRLFSLLTQTERRAGERARP